MEPGEPEDQRQNKDFVKVYDIQKIDQVIRSRIIESLITNGIKFIENAFGNWKQINIKKLQCYEKDRLHFLSIHSQTMKII